jgi:hypothetical protein
MRAFWFVGCHLWFKSMKSFLSDLIIERHVGDYDITQNNSFFSATGTDRFYPRTLAHIRES